MKANIDDLLPNSLDNLKRPVILGVGSELMQDDAAGTLVTKNLIKKFGESNVNFRIYSGHSTPENFSKNIIEFGPDHVIIIDAANFNSIPGSIINIPVEAINDLTLGTHKLSLIMMIKYIREMIKCEFTVIAIQYKSVEFNGKMTKEVKAGVKKVTGLLSGLIGNIINSHPLQAAKNLPVG